MNKAAWFEIYVDDLQRATKFYETVLAVELDVLSVPDNTDNIQMSAFPGDEVSYGAAGALAKMDGMQPGGNSTVIYFSCDDCAVEESRVIPAGGRLRQPKMPIGKHGYCTLAYDTEGNLFGLHSYK